MIKKIINNKLLISAIYCLPFLLAIDSWQRIVFFIIGVFLGIATLLFDESFFSKYYNDKFSDDNSSSRDLATRSTIFILLLAPLSFFVITSTSGTLGKGFVLGLILGIVQEMWLLKKNENLFQSRFLSQLKKNLNSSQRELLVLIATGYFLLISVWSALLK